MPAKISTTKKKDSAKQVVTLTHEEASRKNIPTAEYEPVMEREQMAPIRVAYERRNRDLDPQLVWRGKDEQDWSDLVAPAPPLYIQEKIHPKVLIDDLRRGQAGATAAGEQIDLFADFNGLPSESARTEFYQHDANWSNRMILGDSLQVMASLAEREGLRGQVQCIYIDPPYGIKFNSNFQWSTTSRDVKDGNPEHITREPEQVKAFRDTWRDGIHSYLTYLRDRLTVARDLLADSGSIFVQIGDENVHRVRALMDEVFGDENYVTQIAIKRPTMAQRIMRQNFFYVLWYAKSVQFVKTRKLYAERKQDELPGFEKKSLGIEIDGYSRPFEAKDRSSFKQLSESGKIYQLDNLVAIGSASNANENVDFNGTPYSPGNLSWKTALKGISKLKRAGRLEARGGTLCYKNYLDDYPVIELGNLWEDTAGPNKEVVYVVQTKDVVIHRCVLMTTDPGDLVIDPTCGSGTTAYVAEQWGRRWITIDTSRVALALARARIMGARYPYYLLADSREGQLKEAEIKRVPPSEAPTHGDIRHGFVYERVPHITLKSIANNAEIDVIWEKFQKVLEPLRQQLNAALNKNWEEWEIPREAGESWPAQAKELHAQWWEQRIARQKEIDASIAAKADYEYLYDKPYDDKSKVRVAGPFTVESISPHRTLAVGDNEELIDPQANTPGAKLRRHHSRKPEDLRRAAGAQAGQDRLHFPLAVAGILRLRRRHIYRSRFRQTEARSHLHRT